MFWPPKLPPKACHELAERNLANARLRLEAFGGVETEIATYAVAELRDGGALRRLRRGCAFLRLRSVFYTTKGGTLRAAAIPVSGLPALAVLLEDPTATVVVA
jgi:hypothetical protein